MAHSPDQPDPVALVTAMVAAVNAHDVERASTFFSDDVILTLRPEFPRLGDRTHRGRDYMRQWLQSLVDRDFQIEIAVERTEGHAVRTLTKTTMSTTRRLGVAPLVGCEDYVVECGRITSLTWTTSDETLRKFVTLRRRILTAAAAVVAAVGVLAWWLFGR